MDCACLVELWCKRTDGCSCVQGSAADDQSKALADIMKQAAEMAKQQEAEEAAQQQSASAQSQPDSQKVRCTSTGGRLLAHG